MSTSSFLQFVLFAAVPFFVPAAENADQQIEVAAKTSYTFTRVLDNEVDLNVRRGIATLTGRVRDMDQSRLAEDTVAAIDGVKGVENRIKVDPQAKPASDEWLAVKIRSKLLVKPGISMAHTKVDVKDGVVTLTGTAETLVQKERTEAAIREVSGVRQIRNLISVEPSGMVQRERQPANDGSGAQTGAGLPTGRDALARNPADQNAGNEQGPKAVEDAAIATQIKFELLVNRATSGLAPRVEAENGRVIITGEADSEEQKQQVTTASKSVRGVTAVENRMTIKRR